MQIIIDLHAKDEGAFHSSSEQKKKWEIFHLNELLCKLYDEGYSVNTLYGSFVFDEAKKEVIDCGKPGDNPSCSSMTLANSVLNGDGKLAIIFTNKKYIVFADRYFVAIHFCHMRKVKPLTIYSVYNNFDDLVLKEDKVLLNKLYLKQFESMYGKGAKAKSYLVGDYTLHTKGYAVPGPITNEDKKTTYKA